MKRGMVIEVHIYGDEDNNNNDNDDDIGVVKIEYGRSVPALMTVVCGLPGCYSRVATV